MSTASETSPQATASAEKFTGRVKWFNNNAGYGFITITDGVKSGEDIFVHHTAIVVQSEQYKYLVQGEYVSLSLAPTTNNASHDTQAVGVSGINGGKLMCETRRENKSERGEQQSATPAPAKVQRAATPKSTSVAPKSAPVPVADDSAPADWTPVKKPRATGGRGGPGRGGRGKGGEAGKGQK
jgi:cold shock CspA family protein